MAEIPLQGISQPIEILNNNGAVETVNDANVLNVFLAGTLTGQCNGRVTRKIDHRKAKNRYGQRHQNGNTDTLDRIGYHWPLSTR